MSRSYRKNTYVKDGQHEKCIHRLKSKTIANRAVRRTSNIPCNSAYRKVYNSWCINDFIFEMSEKEFIRRWDSGDEWLHRSFRNYKQAYRWWYTTYKRK